MHEDLVLITSHYNSKNLKRDREIKKCLLSNALHFKTIIVFFENWDQVEQNEEYKYLKSHPKIAVIETNTRQSYRTFFEYAYNNLYDKTIVISNNDILFDCTLNRIHEIDMKNTLIALTRWQLIDINNWSVYTIPIQTNFQMNWSFDSYIFKPRLLNFSNLDDLDILIGISGCDSYLVKKISCQNIAIKNPIYDIRSYHIDHRHYKPPESFDETHDNCEVIINTTPYDTSYDDFSYFQKEDYPWKYNPIPANINSFNGFHGIEMKSDNCTFLWEGAPKLRKAVNAIHVGDESCSTRIEKIVANALELFPDLMLLLTMRGASSPGKIDFFRNIYANWPNVIIVKHDKHPYHLLDSPHINSLLDSAVCEFVTTDIQTWLRSTKKLLTKKDKIVGLKKIPYASTILEQFENHNSELLKNKLHSLCASMNDVQEIESQPS